MSEIIATSQWIKFFANAGLPANVAANYAIIFSDNRIQVDMLMDLSKEYLFDMGIRTMGDVIAILRYAKEFHAQLVKDKVMGKMEVNSSKKAVERMLGHYAKPSSLKSVVPVTISPVRPMPLQKQEITARVPKASMVVNVKRVTTHSAPYTTKVRKVPPEEEGAYRIKMPSGTTAKTRRILQMQKRLQLASKRSVFQRLGGETTVSSSSDIKNPTSVFVRLGSSNNRLHDDIPTSTVVNESEEIRKVVKALPYKGVLKMTVGPQRKISAMNNKNNAQTFRRTVLNPVRAKSAGDITKTISVNRINTILASNTSAKVRSQGVNRNSGVLGARFGNLKTTTDVKSRLGNKVGASKFDKTRLGKATNRIAIHKVSTVFDRLGK